jgi:methylthioribose-1-phosphate isomerase
VRADRAIRPAPDGWSIEIIDQRALPQRLVHERISDVASAARAIAEMRIRGAPLIGAVGAFGLAFGAREDASEPAVARAHATLLATRPTARDLATGLNAVQAAIDSAAPGARADAALASAFAFADESAAQCEAIGRHGAPLLQPRADRPLNVMTHCNAGWLATVDWGTALAPVYVAHAAGLPIHVWVSETRPRRQGWLTAWELGQAGVPCTAVADNACGHLIQRGDVDVIIVGSDRTTARGDVANKIGTYLKALAARAHGVPFYAAVPSTTIDWSLDDGVAGIPIEERSPEEVVEGLPFRARNPGFDVTPAPLVTGIITERGVATPQTLRALFR